MEEMNELYHRDAYVRSFDAVVVQCEAGKNGYEIVLDDTAFYPEEGGQLADHGTLNGIAVTDTKRRKTGEIVHYCAESIEVGTQVHGEIDWTRRYDHMQQHTGEHMLSGLIHQHYGYENVGFHMGDETVMVDFDGSMTWEELLAIEKEANEAIWADEPIEIDFPNEQELSALAYRSKKELSGKVRIVRVPGCDVCACCGTHVLRTGEVGMIKCLSMEKHKNGVRITMVCGGRALSDYNMHLAQNTEISHLLSSRLYETAFFVKALQNTVSQKNAVIRQMSMKYLDLVAKTIDPSRLVVLKEENISPNELRMLGNQLLESDKAVICVLYTNASAENTWNYLMMSSTVGLRDAGKAMNQKLNGRGGGKEDLIQGTWNGSEAEIEAAVSEVLGAL